MLISRKRRRMKIRIKNTHWARSNGFKPGTEVEVYEHPDKDVADVMVVVKYEGKNYSLLKEDLEIDNRQT